MIAISLALVIAIVIPTLAYTYQTTPKYVSSGIVIRTPTVGLGIYWDLECTQPVTPFDFGEIIQPDWEMKLWKRVYIKNEGEVYLDIYWNSTLPAVSTEIAEWWCVRPDPDWGLDPLNGSRFGVGALYVTNYIIKVPVDSAIGIYNWTLTVWGVH